MYCPIKYSYMNKPLTPAQLVRQRGRSLPVYACYAAKEAFENCGEGIVLVVRQHAGGNFTVGAYLVDIWCRGIRDTFYRVRVEKEELDELIEQFETQGIEPVEYEEAHNWVYGALDWAERAGMHQHKGFDTTKFLLADDEDESVPIIEYEFGKDGKHCFVAGSEAELNRYLPILRKTLGGGNFSYIVRL